MNDILKEYWRNKCNRKNETKQRIIDLRKHLSAIRNTATSNLVSMAVWINADDPKEKAIYKDHLETSLKMSGAAFQSARDNMIYYPDDIKSALEEFFSEYQKFTGEIVERPMYKERLYEMSDYINFSLDNIVEMIDKQRFKLIS